MAIRKNWVVKSIVMVTLSSSIGLASPVLPAGLPSMKRDQPPLINLPIPKNPVERSYLGLSSKGYFRISQIKAKALIIQILNIYCPSCQSMATAMAQVYHLIQNDGELRDRINGELRDRIKLIGIFAGNSSNEVEYFKQGHRIPFPVFPDEDYKIHKALGEARTPHLICTVKDDFGNHQIVHTRSGGFAEAETEAFLESMLEAFGFNGKDSLRIRKKLAISATDEISTN